MLKGPLKAGELNIQIFQSNDRLKLQEDVNQWFKDHKDTLVQDIFYAYGYIISNPEDSLSRHYSHGYSVSIVYSLPGV